MVIIEIQQKYVTKTPSFYSSKCHNIRMLLKESAFCSTLALISAPLGSPFLYSLCDCQLIVFRKPLSDPNENTDPL